MKKLTHTFMAWFDAIITTRLCIWSLKRVFGADCATDVKHDFPDDPNIQCASCEARKLIDILEWNHCNP